MNMHRHNPFSWPSGAEVLGAAPSGYGEVQFSDLPRLESWMKTYLGHPLPLFLSEFCVPTAPDRTFNFYIPAARGRGQVGHRRARSAARHARYIYSLGWVNVHDDMPVNSMRAGSSRTACASRDFYAFERN